MARVKRYNSETGQWEYCNTGGMPIKGIDYLTRADYDTMRADIDAYLERNKESVGVTVSGNQGAEDVYGASVRVVGEDGSVLEEKAWGGSELVFRMEAGTVYHVEVDASLQGFSSYKSETFTAIKAGARTVTADVYAEKVNVSVEGINRGFTVTVKEEYTQVEYIESTGAQYIDTGFKPNQDTRVSMDIYVIEGDTSFLFGARVNSSANSASHSYSMAQISGTSLRSDYGSVESSIVVSPLQRLDIEKNKNITTVNGTNITATEQTLSPDYSVYLLAVNTAGIASLYTKARIYSCQIYDDGTLVRDYIPVMNSSGVYGLYDKVNGVFYSSATSTGFTGKAMGDNGVMDTFLTLTETSGSCLVPYGTVYSVSATAVDGYASPSSQTFTANVDSRSVVMVYEESLLGVFIEDTTGKLWTSDAWDGSATANGVAVITENCRFVMALERAYEGFVIWSPQIYVDGILTATDKSTAISDYAGESNTTAIIGQLGAQTAATLCRSYVFPNGQSGYLGAAGEWNAALDNKSAVDYALSKCGGAIVYNYLWTSTQYSDDDAWYLFWSQSSILSITKAASEISIRAFTTLKRDTN